ncbi:YVTN family beta-propeller repeat protein [Hyphomicrobium sp. DMF-1]|uniref:YVTN family beta-propeller repeat protein n=1 Tax=Hyphomicrobium sp. DMF-1 TaxID=3019544 RepID=UPI0022EBBA17|nr:beta-propeller fold lactonase family protein [Hyphomicrobium sp. DMF-1]WBT37186.1 beta-propeller fold lactonase family protein [Hyphomicrobium sp. DMF-1]
MRFLCLRGSAVAAMLVTWLAFASASLGAEKLYVLSQTGAKLTEIDLATHQLGASVALEKAPAALTFSRDSKLAYVTHPDLGKISVVSLGGQKVLRTISVPGSPFGIAVAGNGRIYVADWNGADVAVLEPSDNGATQPRILKVGRAPAHVLLTPDETTLFVANRESDSVSVIRASDLEVVATIAVGRAPFAMALSPDAKRLYVGNVQGGSVSVIDTAALAVVETIKSGAMPYGAAVTPDGARVLVTNQQSSTVAVLEAGGAPRPGVRVGGYPEGVAIDASGHFAYVANWFSDDVSVLDLASLKEIRRIKCPGGPRSVVIARDP